MPFLKLAGAMSLALLVATPSLADDALASLLEAGAHPQLGAALDEVTADGGYPAFARHVHTLATRSDPGDLDRFRTWLDQATDLSDAQRLLALRALANRAFLETRYADAAAALEEAEPLAPCDEQAGIATDRALYQVAADLPPIASIGGRGGQLSSTRDLANLLRVDVTFPDRSSVPMVVDTGAEISVIMDSHARAAGLRFLEGEVEVGTVTEAVTGHLAVADRLQLGDMIFEHVLFLVMPDEELVFADGAYPLDGIMGLQVFNAAGRMSWAEGGQTLTFGEAAPALGPDAPLLFWHRDGVALTVRHDSTALGTFFDSGASRTIFRRGLLDHLSEDERASLSQSTRTRSGVGGTEEVAIQTLGRVDLIVGGHPMTYTNITIDPPEDDEPAADIAALGNDLVRENAQVTLDFDTLRYRIIGRPE